MTFLAALPYGKPSFRSIESDMSESVAVAAFVTLLA